MNQALIRQVWDRAKNRCEYCRIPYPYYRLPFQIDHIVARQHGGMANIDNLALACFHCNCHKGPNLSGWDGGLDRVIRLFHPRSDLWDEHLEFDGPRFLGKTPVGRVTIHVLAMNSEDMVALRIELLQEGILL